jgi:septal ring factor EnvC (AmiA/AmiB activator)
MTELKKLQSAVDDRRQRLRDIDAQVNRLSAERKKVEDEIDKLAFSLRLLSEDEDPKPGRPKSPSRDLIKVYLTEHEKADVRALIKMLHENGSNIKAASLSSMLSRWKGATGEIELVPGKTGFWRLTQ